MRGKKFKSYTAKDRKKDLELFAKTGMHPDIEAARQKAREDTVLALPDSETGPGRPRTFIDLSIGKRLLGVARRVAASSQPPLHPRTHSQIRCLFHHCLPRHSVNGAPHCTSSGCSGRQCHMVFWGFVQ